MNHIGIYPKDIKNKLLICPLFPIRDCYYDKIKIHAHYHLNILAPLPHKALSSVVTNKAILPHILGLRRKSTETLHYRMIILRYPTDYILFDSTSLLHSHFLVYLKIMCLGFSIVSTCVGVYINIHMKHKNCRKMQSLE